MANIKISILFFGIFSLSTFVFSCTKENNDSKEKMDNSMTTESRSFCPDYLDVAGCASTTSGTTLGGTLIYEGCQIPFVYYMVKCDWGVYFEPPVIDWNSVFSTIWLNGGANTPCTDLANKMLSLSIQGKTGEFERFTFRHKKTNVIICSKEIYFV
ncbi:MAG: hypothetical protein IPN79_14090 [Saprospiraceae bacterium]|nr:hypothetical protein [Saprospiraceae bacterium]